MFQKTDEVVTRDLGALSIELRRRRFQKAPVGIEPTSSRVVGDVLQSAVGLYQAATKK